MILEQLPEMLIQMYTFQLMLLKTIAPATENEYTCFNGSANESRSDINKSDSSWMCNVFNMNEGIDYNLLVRKVSIVVPHGS